jgi:short subunit dehydrogenase-like uncharacterized protein
MTGDILIYGATGYSGRLVARALRDAGLQPIIAGRDPARTEATAAALALPYRIARVDDPATLARALAGVAVVVNAAGPFSHTVDAVVRACLAGGAHYLDLCAEVPVLQRLTALHADARDRGVMIMPGVGFDVVPTDSLAAHVARRVRSARSLTLAVSKPAFLSPGSAKTLLENVDLGVARRNGAITRLALGSIERSFDFGAGPRACLNVSFADVVTAFHTTGIPNITTFAEATPLLRLLPFGLLLAPWLRTPAGDALGRALADAVWRDPPGGTDPSTISMAVVAEVEDGNGGRARARLTTPEAYDFTGTIAAAIARRVHAGEAEPGFQTPARFFGPDFVLSLPGVARHDLA